MINLPISTLICRQSLAVFVIALIVVAIEDIAAGVSYLVGGVLVVIADAYYFWRLSSQTATRPSSDKVFGVYLKAVLGKTVLIMLGLAFLFWLVGIETPPTEQERLSLQQLRLAMNPLMLTMGVVITAIVGSLSNTLVIAKQVTKRRGS